MFSVLLVSLRKWGGPLATVVKIISVDGLCGAGPASDVSRLGESRRVIDWQRAYARAVSLRKFAAKPRPRTGKLGVLRAFGGDEHHEIRLGDRIEIAR